MVKILHNLIADTAKAIAREAYESIAHDNAFYAEWPDMHLFVAANFQMFVPEARTALMKMLEVERYEDGKPVYVYPEAIREPIYEAFLKDGLMKNENRATRRANRVLNA